jgi:uncharacterized protein
MAALCLSSLTYYPIKSAAGTSVPAWEVDDFGLRHDRRWMVVEPDGHFITQRTSPRLALVRPQIRDSSLFVEAPGTDPLVLPLEPEHAEPLTVQVWDDTCQSLWLGEEAAAWFTRFLGFSCGLVYMGERQQRPIDPLYAPHQGRVSFADAFPFLLLSEASLTDLNGRLAKPLPMNRFRPNLVIEGGAPFVEDSLRDFAVSGIRFQVVKPCDRCVITTTDQRTTERSVEPLRTLATYRRVNGKVYFGQNVVHQGTGRITVGASLLV